MDWKGTEEAHVVVAVEDMDERTETVVAEEVVDDGAAKRRHFVSEEIENLAFPIPYNLAKTPFSQKNG